MPDYTIQKDFVIVLGIVKKKIVEKDNYSTMTNQLT